MDITTIFEFSLWGNTGEQYFWAFVSFIGLVIVFKVFQVIVLRKLKALTKKTDTDIDDFALSLVNHIKPPFYIVVSFFLAAQFLNLSEFLYKVIFGMLVIILVVQAISTAQKIIDYFIKKKILASGDASDKDKEAIVTLAAQLSKGALWIFGGLLILSNIGVDVTSLIAGMGIGGIAIALAVKDVLGDIFASFSIFWDKPFKVGDFIEISPNEKGTVEKVGIKTTRLRTIQGQQLVVANKTLTETTIQNYRRMEKRQSSYLIGVAYETPRGKLRRIPNMIKEIITEQSHASVVRVYLKELGDFSVNFEVVYKMDEPDIDTFAKTQQAIHLKTLQVFDEEGIELAYPTQTVIVQKQPENNK